MANSANRVLQEGGVGALRDWADSVSESSGFQMVVGVGPGATTITSYSRPEGHRDDVLSPGDVLWAPRSVHLREKGYTQQQLTGG